MTYKDKIKQLWKKLNETKVEEIIPYIKNNKKASLLICLSFFILVGVILLIRYNLSVLKSSPAEAPAQPPGKTPSGPTSAMLPETKRNIEGRSATRDPFAGSMKLKGVITSGGGGNLAIIEVGNISNIVAEGAEVTGGLKVSEIKNDQVILMSDSNKVYLGIDGKSKTEKIDTTKKVDH